MIGAIITLPIDAEDRLCIVLDMKTYYEFCEFAWGDMTILIAGEISYWTSTSYPYRDKDSMCYELMFGDEKAWFLGDLLLGAGEGELWI